MSLLQSLTAKPAMAAEEEKSSTAEGAMDANEAIIEPNSKENAKTTPSMEWPRRGCD